MMGNNLNNYYFNFLDAMVAEQMTMDEFGVVIPIISYTFDKSTLNFPWVVNNPSGSNSNNNNVSTSQTMLNRFDRVILVRVLDKSSTGAQMPRT